MPTWFIFLLGAWAGFVLGFAVCAILCVGADRKFAREYMAAQRRVAEGER